MPNQEIVINLDKIKAALIKTLKKLNNFYLKLNQELVFFWRRILDKQSDNGINRTLRILLDDEATTLFINTIFIGVLIFLALFFRLDSPIIGYLQLLVPLNIVAFCLNIIFKDKLK